MLKCILKHPYFMTSRGRISEARVNVINFSLRTQPCSERMSA